MPTQLREFYFKMIEEQLKSEKAAMDKANHKSRQS